MTVALAKLCRQTERNLKMRKHVLIALASIVIAGLGVRTASAQFPDGLKMPKLPKREKAEPAPTPAGAAQPKPPAESRPALPGGLAIMKHWVSVVPKRVNQYRGDWNTYSWTPVVRFLPNGPRPSGASYYAKVSLPGGAPWVEMDCDWDGNFIQCGGPNFPVEKATTATGLFPFEIRLRNALQGTDQLMFGGRVKIGKGPDRDGLTPAEGAKQAVFYTDLEAGLPLGYVYYNHGRNEFRAAFWTRVPNILANLRTEAHVFYRGQEIAFDLWGKRQLVEGRCSPVLDILPGSMAKSVNPQPNWYLLECTFNTLPIKNTGDPNLHHMASKPGEYEIKILRNNRLSRSLKFTVGADGNLAGGIPILYETTGDDYRPNSIGVIVPVAILDDQDGPWDKNAWKTDALYGNPPAGFTWPPQ